MPSTTSDETRRRHTERFYAARDVYYKTKQAIWDHNEEFKKLSEASRQALTEVEDAVRLLHGEAKHFGSYMEQVERDFFTDKHYDRVNNDEAPTAMAGMPIALEPRCT